MILYTIPNVSSCFERRRDLISPASLFYGAACGTMQSMIEQLKIGGTNYRVIYEADPLNPDGSVIYGQTDVSLAIICINSKLEASVQLSTLLHETIHGILNHAGYADEHPEKLIEIIANGLLQVLGDNAELRKALPYHEETN